LHTHKKAIGSITDGLKEALFTAGPGEVFIGFAGTTVAFESDEERRIFSFSTILLNLSCIN